MYKTTTTYVVDPKTRLDKIMPNGLPINAFIDKGRCAIGGTYSEIKNKKRCTFIVVPNISIEHSKQRSHPEIDIVYGDISPKQVKEMFLSKKQGHKIMTTPEGMLKIMNVAEELNITKEVYDNWFLLLDEAHTFISEAYRKDILRPFQYFWSFKAKSIISATPFEFSDPIFRTLDHHKIIFNAPLGTVTLVHAKSVEGTLDYLLKNLDKYPGNLHIFYNSITQIVAAIRRAGLTLKQFKIFCADDKESKNMDKLGDLITNFVAEPTDECYSKVNFYTCKYFEGWDLNDLNATMVFVSDINKPQTCLGVRSKGKQSFGRLRSGEIPEDEPYQLIHITNARNLNHIKPLSQFNKDFYDEGRLTINYWNAKVALRAKHNRAVTETTEIIKFADINIDTKLATLNPLKLDQQINEAANNEIYNHIDFIKKDWEDGYFEVEVLEADHKVETKTAMKRKSKSQQLEDDYSTLKQFKIKQETTMIFTFGQTPEQEISHKNPTAYKAFRLLDEATMVNLNYNVKKVETAIILKENTMVELKLTRLLNQQFRPGLRYSNADIKSKLQSIYDQLNIRISNGKIKVAKATDLKEEGWFDTDKCKLKVAEGEYENGNLIIRANFNILMAA
ncbi:DEAD/DEAH box helicase family protein [Mucilaginibacter lappiensis]|uniref:DEAD/DEAH box helicase family protein n=1 Tax=Mucilaginibacter lappiensis TaxID=354630 RepID=UPI003D2563EB